MRWRIIVITMQYHYMMFLEVRGQEKNQIQPFIVHLRAGAGWINNFFLPISSKNIIGWYCTVKTIILHLIVILFEGHISHFSNTILSQIQFPNAQVRYPLADCVESRSQIPGSQAQTKSRPDQVSLSPTVWSLGHWSQVRTVKSLSMHTWPIFSWNMPKWPGVQ